MKQQVVVIHGGTTFKNYEDYIVYLKTKELTLEKLKPQKDWKNNLQENLGESFVVLLPRMPNGINAEYLEWELWFERILELVQNDTIFIGHSLGGIFLAKYFSTKKVNKKIKAVILVAAPFDDANGGESLTDFKLPQSLEKFSNNCKSIFLFHSKDDPIVPFIELEKYKKALPSAKAEVFENRQHFNMENITEIVDLVTSLV